MKTVKKVVGLSMAAVAVLVSGTVLIIAPASADITKSKYTESGKGGYVSIYNYQDCGESYASLDFSQSLYKDGSNKSTSNSSYFYLSSYNWCDDTYKWCDGYIDLPNFNISNSLKNGHIKGTNAVSCVSGSWWGGYSGYTENITADVTLTCPNTAVNDKYRDRYTSSGPWGKAVYSYSANGSYCDGAQATGSITGDVDTNITIAQENSYGYLSNWKNKSASVEKYKP